MRGSPFGPGGREGFDLPVNSGVTRKMPSATSTKSRKASGIDMAQGAVESEREVQWDIRSKELQCYMLPVALPADMMPGPAKTTRSSGV